MGLDRSAGYRKAVKSLRRKPDRRILGMSYGWGMRCTHRIGWGLGIALLWSALQAGAAFPNQIAVRYPEGTTHGLFILRALDNKEIGSGELVETIEGQRVTSKLTLHFNDGSVYDETTQFIQDGRFRVLTYHLSQKGPAFKEALDMTVNAPEGTVTVHNSGDQGRDKVWTRRMKIPSDIGNGILPYLLKNLSPGAAETTVSMVVATPKPRLVSLTISPQGLEAFPFDGSKLEAMRYALKIDIGGISGSVAKIAGRQPPDTFVWMLHSKVPLFLMAQETLEGGPVCRIELAAPVLPVQDEPGKTGE